MTNSLAPIFGPDWTSHHFADWTKWLGHLAGRPVHGLEIGSFEGRSARWFMQNVCTAAESTLTCVDPFDYAEEHSHIAGGGTFIDQQFDWQQIRERCLHNLHPWMAQGRLRLMPVASRLAFAQIAPVPYFDFVYVDGGHLACCALEDAVQAWPRLQPGGILIWDDYRWSQNRPPPAGIPAEVMRPQLAIDCWLRVYAGQYDDLADSNDQIKIRKL